MNTPTMKAVLAAVTQVVRPVAVPLKHFDGAPVEMCEPRLAADLVPHVYRPMLSALVEGTTY